ncbi:glutamate ABC transporter substrate-binding protein [Microbacterium sp. EYE_5]|uniref:glutamate ABC transporter substrate-binding protein n=1 Tax=unclassified Microbacterium TaxID=2609290 RepID=UPI0020043DAE|nr:MULTISPECIES: glutamate ABC transporter substrate-binding protein [unclassified Microbacterium]MCK6081885.1 glutamate ABC transporter substrate-binding protein [Microbacterium sp. EYE_382]MCK6087155.1 glutamate ABC transporter substrate-binding protein [Microbacterium sp. EYE_384]MCK6124867.1 glutamate ABC transporter substrate-binding protein [Microbacterium sp. EYE_80]MCK6127918.1 glutamate ABC transporter substrate-binding protein [Microbacterium sp. EYE_79]MCK6142839.1 glutamate ABC tra
MRKTRIAGTFAGIAIAALALAGCNSGSPTSPGAEGGEGGDALWEVASDVSLDGSPTFDAMTERDGVVVGVKNDQPGLGYEDAASGERTGFDVDTARWIAASLGFDEDQIEYKTIPSANREQAIVNGDIDYYVGTYSITDERKEQVDFAGPYFITGQGLLVAADDDSINGPDDLAGKVVCSVTGSTPLQRIRDEYNPGDTREFDTYSQCIDQLLQGQVDAITTDEAILAGYVAQRPDELKIAGEPFSEEKYGVGLPKGDTALLDHINTLFTDGGDVWTALFDEHLAPAGIEGTQPDVEN